MMILIIVPAYTEEKDFLARSRHHDHAAYADVLVVDDGSRRDGPSGRSLEQTY
jgi:hypothetical protein